MIKRRKGERWWNYWTGVVIRLEKQKDYSFDFFQRNLYRVKSLNDEHLVLSKIPMARSSGLRRITKPQEGDVVRLRYLRHLYPEDDKIEDSKIIEVIKRVKL